MLKIFSFLFFTVVCLESCNSRLTVNSQDNQITIVEVPTNDKFAYTYLTLKDDCSCTNMTCKCCLTLNIPEIGVYFDGCGKIKYDPDALQIDLIVTINDRVIIEEKLSAHNPPPVCIGKPITFDLADICIKLYDLDYSKNHFKGCSRLEGRLEEIEVVKIELGCWNLVVKK